MTTWMIWFNQHSETASLWKWELDELKLVGDFTFEEIKSHTGEDPVRGFFHTESVSFLETILPKTTEKKLRLALPGLLEEQLAASPEENFFALPVSYQFGETVTVAVINTVTLEKMVHASAQAGINLLSLTPDCFLLTQPDEQASVKMNLSDRVVVRTSMSAGFAIPSQHAVLLMRELDQVQALAPRYTDDIPYNFLQGQFLPKQPKKPMGKMAWLYVGLAGLLGLHFIILIIVGAVLSSRLEAIKTKNLALYAQVFPGATKVNSPKIMIEREMQNFGAGALDPIQKLVFQLSQALSQTTGSTLNTLDYAHGRLTADLTLPDMNALEQLNNGLAQFGIHSEQQVTEQDNTVLVNLVIHSGEKP